MGRWNEDGDYEDEEDWADLDEEDCWAEEGICQKCGKPYRKTVGESNVSFTGLCFSCGFNP